MEKGAFEGRYRSEKSCMQIVKRVGWIQCTHFLRELYCFRCNSMLTDAVDTRPGFDVGPTHSTDV